MNDSRSMKLADDGLQWLDRHLEADKLSSKPARKGPPPLPTRSPIPLGDTIEVDSRWLLPPLPRGGPGNANGAPRKPPSLPLPIGVKAGGKLPPPLPR
jgi:hypothetical protein